MALWTTKDPWSLLLLPRWLVWKYDNIPSVFPPTSPFPRTAFSGCDKIMACIPVSKLYKPRPS
jgi:hypothetical protein